MNANPEGEFSKESFISQFWYAYVYSEPARLGEQFEGQGRIILDKQVDQPKWNRNYRYSFVRLLRPKMNCGVVLVNCFFVSSPSLPWQHGRRQQGWYIRGTLKKQFTKPTPQLILGRSIQHALMPLTRWRLWRDSPCHRLRPPLGAARRSPRCRGCSSSGRSSRSWSPGRPTSAPCTRAEGS